MVEPVIQARTKGVMTMPQGTILIVGEGAASIRDAARWWEADGYRASVIDLKREGLHLAALDKFDLVVLDGSLSPCNRRSFRRSITAAAPHIAVLPHA